MFHVLEHLPNPEEVLMELKSHLKYGGLLVIETPNADDILIEKSQAFRDFTFRSDHVMLYTHRSLIMLLSRIGLQYHSFKFIQRYNASNHVKWYECGLPDGHKEENEWSNSILNKEYSDELAKLGKSDTLFIIVKNG